jgi:uncharacterized membrane protein YphA (DoxX/SURF4 family)
MKFMGDSMAYPAARSSAIAAPLDLPRWKAATAITAAILLGALFIVSGVWKITDPFGAATRMMQAKVPGPIALPFAIALGVGETLAGAMLFVPRFRRWGAALTGFLLVAFMIYIGIFYNELRGEECSCFPWLKRAVGPGFFIGDAVMLALAALAGWWARPSNGLRPAALTLAVISVFAAASYGFNLSRNQGVEAPSTIAMDGGATQSLREGRILLYFFDPMCTHCNEAARAMAKHNWMGNSVIAIPTQSPQYAQGFLNDTGLKARLSPDAVPLKKVFPFTDPPFAVALENGRARATLSRFDHQEPAATLRQLGFIE